MTSIMGQRKYINRTHVSLIFSTNFFLYFLKLLSGQSETYEVRDNEFNYGQNEKYFTRIEICKT